MKYKAIGFDFGGVVRGVPGSVFVEKVCKEIGVTKEQYQEAYFRHNKKVNRGEVTWEELWKLVLTDLGCPDKVQAVMDISNASFNDKINTNILDLADDLRANGYRTGLLSNNTREAAQFMRDEGIDKHFDVMQISAETGLVKPESESFTHFAEELGVQPSEMIFIDDSEKSLSTSEEVGFAPLLFESYDQLVEQLKQLSIL
jgi:putative hydrolase of the HAD superfamily